MLFVEQGLRVVHGTGFAYGIDDWNKGVGIL